MEKSKEDGAKESTSTELKEWKISDRRAQDVIRLCLADNILINMTSKKTTKDLRKKLENLSQSKLLVHKLFVQKQLYNL